LTCFYVTDAARESAGANADKSNILESTFLFM